MILAPLLATATGVSSASIILQDAVTWSGNGNRYQVAHVPSGISWHDARDQATALGGFLVSIHSDGENDFVKSLIRGQTSLWSAGGYRGCWLGGYQVAGSSEPLGGWSWASGEAWTYSAWGSGEPNNAAGYEHMLEIMDFAGGYGLSPSVGWNDMHPTGGGWGPMKTFIVEFNAIPAPGIMAVGVGAGLVMRRRRG
ncbi:MAG: lectin-like protein [Phycisphaerales bacterium]